MWDGITFAFPNRWRFGMDEFHSTLYDYLSMFELKLIHFNTKRSHGGNCGDNNIGILPYYHCDLFQNLNTRSSRQYVTCGNYLDKREYQFNGHKNCHQGNIPI